MENVLELVSFKLNKGVTENDLLEAAEQSQKFVSTLPGFCYRSLSHNAETNEWTDSVYWSSMEEALNAGKQFPSSADCAPLMALIDAPTVKMQHSVVKMKTCGSQQD
ncbi:hypothetical protein [Vibrio sonorensis]|uniref:hypothetical protein n=1 Tax=Vibrio sonorensis TaxID=1004316 RepID=UPI0008DA9564|nr:hypothetical protein [Vibrio sonorensis]